MYNVYIMGQSYFRVYIDPDPGQNLVLEKFKGENKLNISEILFILVREKN